MLTVILTILLSLVAAALLHRLFFSTAGGKGPKADGDCNDGGQRKREEKKAAKPAHVTPSAALPEFGAHSVLGFKNRITAAEISPLGDLAAAAAERSLRIASRGDISGGEAPFSQAAGAKAFVVTNLPLDDISALAWDGGAPDRKPNSPTHLAVALSNSRDVLILRVAFDPSTGRFDVRPAATVATSHGGPIASLCLSISGNALLTAGTGPDLTVHAFHPRTGSELGAFNTNRGELLCAAGTLSARFWAAGGFTSDAIVLEFSAGGGGGGKRGHGTSSGALNRAMSLRGHSSGVASIAFGAGETRCATGSRDGTWIVHDVGVRYDLSEDPRRIVSGKGHGAADDKTITTVAINDKADRLAVGDASGVVVFELPSGKALLTVPDMAVEPRWGLRWIGGSNAYLAAVAVGDKRVQVWKLE